MEEKIDIIAEDVKESLGEIKKLSKRSDELFSKVEFALGSLTNNMDNTDELFINVSKNKSSYFIVLFYINYYYNNYFLGSGKRNRKVDAEKRNVSDKRMFTCSN